jgi:pimeloyl-ACP methyl ester carboxylesterase
VEVPIKGLSNASLSVIDLWPEDVEQTIVLVHGLAGCAETWEHQINHFAREFRVVVPDLRGHGQSDAPYSQYTMPEMIDDYLSPECWSVMADRSPSLPIQTFDR